MAVSGGLDSTVAAAVAKQNCHELYIFHVNYGQKGEAKEQEAVGKIREALGAKEVISVVKSNCLETFPL